MAGAPFPVASTWFHSTEMDPEVLAANIALATDPTGVVPAGQAEFWFSDSWYASRYYGPNTVRATLQLINPLYVTVEQQKEARIGPSSGWARRAREAGHDSVIIHDIMDGDAYSTICAIFDPALAEVVPHSRWNEKNQDFDLISPITA